MKCPAILQTINKYPYCMLIHILTQSQHCYNCLLVYLVPSRPLIMKAWIELLLSRFGRVRLCATPWTAAHQAPLSTGFSRQEYWSEQPFPYSMVEHHPSLYILPNAQHRHSAGYIADAQKIPAARKSGLLCLSLKLLIKVASLLISASK